MVAAVYEGGSGTGSSGFCAAAAPEITHYNLRKNYDFWHLMKHTIFAIVGGGRARDLDEEVGGRGVFGCHVALLRRLGILGNEEGGVGGRRRVPDGGGSSAAAAPPVK